MDLKRICLAFIAVLWVACPVVGAARSAPLVIDHTCTDIARIPVGAILAAKAMLHIAYGHTSHGSQVTSGMSGLVAFADGGGKGLAHPPGMFAWNRGGTGGALDLHDYAMSGDVGYYPQWVDNTRSYLEAPAHAHVNVVMWSWCGQVDSKYAAGRLLSEYLTPMSELEADYPHITFIYMTGHVDHADDSNNKAASQIIRDYCRTYNKVLFDFADIESYDPDGRYYPFPHDNCDYYASLNGSRQGNWAQEWQNSHVLGVDWYASSAAHSQPLNANQIIRDYCRTYNKVLLDFADIESYDPDGRYYPFPHDNCDYYASRTGSRQGNWAQEWQNSHALGVDWYASSAAHSQPLNANQKAYAIWWLWGRLAGWPGPAGSGDLNGDGRVDARDLAILSEQWLTESEVVSLVDDGSDTDKPVRR